MIHWNWVDNYIGYLLHPCSQPLYYKIKNSIYALLIKGIWTNLHYHFKNYSWTLLNYVFEGNFRKFKNYLLYSYKLRETFRLGYGFVCMSRCMTLTQSTSLIWEKILSWFNNTCTCIYFLKCHDVNTGSFFIYCRICNNLIIV